MNKSILKLAPLALACALATDALAAQRVFVRSNGVDAGTCTLAAPCRGFTYAMTQVDPGGEVVALDAAGYGAVTIAKSVTITTNAGFFAGIAASTGNAITISTPEIAVVLRGLALNGVGAVNGILMDASSNLTVENCVISGFTNHGIAISGSSTARIVDSVVRGNGTDEVGGNGVSVAGNSIASLNNVKLSRNAGAGLGVEEAAAGTSRATALDVDSAMNNIGFLAAQTGTGNARISIQRSSASANGGGILVFGTGSHASVSSSHISNNGTGLINGGSSGLLESFGNNIIKHNASTSSGTITAVAGQ